MSLVVCIVIASSVSAAPPDSAKSAAAIKAFRTALAVNSTSLTDLAANDFATVPLTKADAATARDLLWQAHVAFIKKDRAAEVKDRVLKEDKFAMPFFYKLFGEKPPGGRSLWISMHGGGNAPARTNDQQYQNQQRLYTLAEGVYLAPRAPTNTWNLWHEPHIDRMFTRLIEDLIVLEDVNPDKVYILGYSAGGDGVWQLGPRMADAWAAAAMMAGHPNGVPLLSLRNCPFFIQCGGNDSAYNRNKVCKEYGDKLDQLQTDDPFGYVHGVKIHEGKPHWMGGEDKAALPWMAKFTRDPIPDRVVWKQSGTPHTRFYWLAVPPEDAKGDSLVVADRKGQSIEVSTAEKINTLLVRLDDRMLDLDKPVTVKVAGKEIFKGDASRTIGTLIRTLDGRGDPKLVFDAEVTVPIAGK
jgi:predicted peptidase